MNKYFLSVHRFCAGLPLCAVVGLSVDAVAENNMPQAQLRKSSEGGGSSYQVVNAEFPHGANRMASLDLNRDGLLDLLVGHKNGVAVYIHSGDPHTPYDTQAPDATLVAKTPGSLGWVAVNNSVYAIRNNREVYRWQWQADHPQTDHSTGSPLRETVVLESLSAVLPQGVFALNFVRDINADGNLDLIIPQAGELAIHLGEGDGRWRSPFTIASQSQVDVRIRTRDNLNEMVGQSITIPQLNTRDVNADGRLDLIVESEQRLSIFLANPQGQYAGSESFGLDLTEVRERLWEVDFDKVNYNNLSSLVSYGFSFLLTDIDGDEIDDLLLREAGRVVVFAGSDKGMDLKKPRQVLKSAGNVLGIMLRDEDGDGRLDLWLSRLEDISIGNIFMWMAISGSVDVEVFVYKNTGNQFARRPHRKLTVSYSFPSLFRSADLVVSAFADQEGGQQSQAKANQLVSGKAILVEAGEDSASQSVAQLVGDELWLYNNINKALQNQFLGVMDYSPKRDAYAVDLQAILENPTVGDSDQKLLTIGQTPSARYPIDAAKPIIDFAALRLNSDEVQDFVLIAERNQDSFAAEFWVSQ